MMTAGAEFMVILEGVAIIVLGAGVLGVFALARSVSGFESQMKTWTGIIDKRMDDHETRIRSVERACPGVHAMNEGAQS